MMDFDIPELDRVRVLPIELSNQIAAGEVVERPASALRELMENALDAGATRIDVEIEEGGARLIRVTDNGFGMSPSDAERAIQRHATSKILTKEDLFRIASLGFRGEALPSIASVSRFELVTRQARTIAATRVYVEGGSLKLVEPWSAPVGTSVTVRDLFYNTPARQKFLKTKGTEQRACIEVIEQLALPRPNVSFSLKLNGRHHVDYPAVEDIWTRIQAVVGFEEGKLFFPTDVITVDDHETWGFVGAPSIAGRTGASIQTFVNGRAIRDRAIIQAVRMGYETLIDRAQYPKVFLFTNVPLDAIDVNVHPAKSEVRFQNPQAVHASIRRSVRFALQNSPWASNASPTAGVPQPSTSSFALQAPSIPASAMQTESLQLWSGPTRSYTLQRDTSVETSGIPDVSFSGSGVLPRIDAPGFAPATLPPRFAGLGETAQTEVAPGFFQSLHYIGPLHNLYLLMSDGRGLVIIDQHASHERITFERLRTSWRQRETLRQPNLIPQMVTLNAVRAMTLHEHFDFFERLGFDLEPFGDNDFALRATPGWFSDRHFNKLLIDTLDELADVGQSGRLEEAIDSILSRMACHGSVRAGDTLTHAEVRALLEQLDACDFGANCPHGRPVYFSMPLEELETRFHRR